MAHKNKKAKKLVNKKNIKVSIKKKNKKKDNKPKPKKGVNKKKKKENKTLGVSVITCTNRQKNIDNVFRNFITQDYDEKELIVILNKNDMNIEDWRQRAKDYGNIRIYQLDEKFTLSECLYFALKKAKYDYIAKFDDDDYYGPDYLKSSIIAFNHTDADIIGKRTAYVYFEDNELLALRYPDYEYQYVDYVLDSSMVIKRKVFDKVKFPNQITGAFFIFQLDCIKKGIKIFSIDKHNYLFKRGKSKEEHTWKIEDKDLLKECSILVNTDNYERYVSKKRDWDSLYKNKISLKTGIDTNKYLEGTVKIDVKNNGISIITCTNRQNYMDNVFQNFIRQNFEDKELIIILNNNDMNLKEWEDKTKEHENIRVFRLDERFSLGECLNFGIEKAKYDYIAKFDDDDYYGPQYLSDSIYNLISTNSDIVGKAAYHVYLKKSRTLAVRMPNEENSWVKFVNGPTMVFKKDIFKKVKFRNITAGEDVAFCKDCISSGFKIYSSNRFHHVYMRHTNEDKHTFELDDEEFLKCCVIIARNIDNYEEYVNLKKKK